MNFLGKNLAIRQVFVDEVDKPTNIKLENGLNLPIRHLLAACILNKAADTSPRLMYYEDILNNPDTIYAVVNGNFCIYNIKFGYLDEGGTGPQRPRATYWLTSTKYGVDGEILEREVRTQGFEFTDLETLTAGETIDLLEEIINQGEVKYKGKIVSGTRISSDDQTESYWYTHMGGAPMFVDHPLMDKVTDKYVLPSSAKFITWPKISASPLLVIPLRGGGYSLYGEDVLVYNTPPLPSDEWADPRPLKTAGFRQMAAAVPGDLLRFGDNLFVLLEGGSGELELMDCTDGNATAFRISSDRTTVGAAKDNDIQIHGAGVEEHHALLRMDEKNAVVYVYDAATEAGTQVMNLLAPPGGLKDGDILYIGRYAFTYTRDPEYKSGRDLSCHLQYDAEIRKGINRIPFYVVPEEERGIRKTDADEPTQYVGDFVVWVTKEERDSSGDLIAEEVSVYGPGRHVPAGIARAPMALPIHPRRTIQETLRAI